MITSALIFLSAAVIIVPITQRLGLGSVLGYLMAGVLIGPWGFGWIGDVEEVLHFSELGVVLLLFLIGLELEPKKLWSMRVPIFGLGGAQVFLNTVVIGTIAWLLGFRPEAALVVGMGFALSSTAIALQILNESQQLNTTAGNRAFSILLFQDIIVIPMIAVLPLIATNPSATSSKLSAIETIGVLIATLVIGRFVLRYALRIIASLHVRELFTAFALLVVLGMAGLMSWLEISMALGAFMAGVLLADSEYRHALETDIEPFKGLLLGLFFISVGMSINLQSVLKNPLPVIGGVAAVIIVKALVHLWLARRFGVPAHQQTSFSVVIGQVGEFAFVLFSAAAAQQIVAPAEKDLLLAITAVSMLFSPLCMKVLSIASARKNQATPNEDGVIENTNPRVIIAGFGRFGQIIGRLLYSQKISATVLDHEPSQIELLKKFGFKVYYGDATRVDLLEQAGAKEAEILVVAVDDVDSSLKIIDHCRGEFPHLKIFARARNVQHMYELLDRQVEVIERETFESALRMGESVLARMGFVPFQAKRAADVFRRHNLQMIQRIHPQRKDEKYLIAQAKQAQSDLEVMMEREQQLRSQPDEW